MIETVYDYDALPKKRMAAGALFLNEQGKILIVKPTYRQDWLFPGGVVEEQESPRTACMREVQEELNLTVPLHRLLCIEYLSHDQKQTECIQFTFYGGLLSESQIAAIALPEKELCEYRFVSIAEASTLLSVKLAKRLPYCLEALTKNATAYLEDGQKLC